ncbi:MAG: methyltransferase domain-containing protein [Chloroflexi bacterium]|nr:methyltransferase domain-containing protein [Chloroflexota bacterium]
MSVAVRDYFERSAADFDRIYSGRKGWLLRWLDRALRADMYERFALTLDACADVAGRSVLDVGCGSGRYAIALAERGAVHVLGVDLAEQMLGIAARLAQQRGVDDVCHFVRGDFLALPLIATFDYAIAIGVFDYVADADALLGKMAASARRRLVASFPSTFPVRTQVRRWRYARRNCPLYFYDEERIAALFERCGLRDYRIAKIRGPGYDYVAVADL